jgi:glycine oxidase
VPSALLSDVEPAVSPDATGALLVPMHGFVGVGSLTRAALAAAATRGTRLHVATGAVHIAPSAEGGAVVRTADRTWTADTAVMAAGSWSTQVTIEGADAVPVVPIRGQLLQLQAARGLLRRVIWGTAGYLVPWPDGTVLAGATVEDVGFDESLTDEGCAGLRAMAAALVPALADAPLVEARTGLRPKGPDDLPLIGRSVPVPALIYATGHYRNGVLLAPYTAQLVRRLVTDPSTTVPEELRPERHGRRL